MSAGLIIAMIIGWLLAIVLTLLIFAGAGRPEEQADQSDAADIDEHA